MEAGADTGATKGYWLAPHGLLGQFSYETQNHQSKAGATHNGLGLPLLITNSENASQLLLMEAFPQLRLPSL